MGQSTDAILVYGIDFGDEPPWPEFDEPEEEYDEEACKLLNPLGWMVFNGDAVDGIVIVRHCSGDCPMYIVGVAGTELRAWRGSPKTVAGLETKPEWDAALQAFLLKNNIQTDEHAAWL